MNEEHQERQRHTKRDPRELKNLQTRLNRIIGQLSGIQKMLDENRYCGEILNQIAASESALQQVGYIILKTHMETCVSEDIRSGKENSLDEAFDLMKKLK